MIIFDEDRASDSPFVERVWHCHSEGAHSFLSIAASRSELVVSRLQGKISVTQPHLTRSLKHFIGQTPAHILQKSRPEQMSFLYKTMPLWMSHNIPVR